MASMRADPNRVTVSAISRPVAMRQRRQDNDHCRNQGVFRVSSDMLLGRCSNGLYVPIERADTHRDQRRAPIIDARRGLWTLEIVC